MNQVSEDVQAIIARLFAIDITPEVSRPEAQFGDVTTNVALQLAGRVGKPPRQVAEQIASELQQHDYAAVSVAGPGFINVQLRDTTLLAQTNCLPQTRRSGQTIVIETNNPNPFKAMHIGHAYNAILADTIANLLAVDGASVYRVSYHGDVGLHVGKSMYSLLRYADGAIAKIEQIPAGERNSFMSRMYAEGSKAYQDDAQARAEIDELAAQSFHPTSDLYIQIYNLCKQWSFEQIDSTVARLKNVPVERKFLESEADARGVAIVKRYTPAVFQQSKGAYIFAGSHHGSFDNVFVSSNGRGLYAARDLGLMELKHEYYHPQYSYIVTGGEQRAYFKGVIAAAGQVWPERAEQTVNIPTGLVKLTTGKMSSRDGDVIAIDWLFDEFRQAIRQRGGEPTEAIMAGALRYQFLKVKIGSDVVFDVNEAVSLTGNTGSYLQYAYARACRILESSQQTVAYPKVVQPEDRDLLRKLGEYADSVNMATHTLQPHHICTYLFELAQEFNRYYEHNHVLGSQQQDHRLAIVKRYADTLQAGLALLGIPSPQQM